MFSVQIILTGCITSSHVAMKLADQSASTNLLTIVVALFYPGRND